MASAAGLKGNINLRAQGGWEGIGIALTPWPFWVKASPSAVLPPARPTLHFVENFVEAGCMPPGAGLQARHYGTSFNVDFVGASFVPQGTGQYSPARRLSQPFLARLRSPGSLRGTLCSSRGPQGSSPSGENAPRKAKPALGFCLQGQCVTVPRYLLGSTLRGYRGRRVLSGGFLLIAP